MLLDTTYSRLLRMSHRLFGRAPTLRWRPVLYEVAEALDVHRRMRCMVCRRRVPFSDLRWSDVRSVPAQGAAVLRAHCGPCWGVAGRPPEVADYSQVRSDALAPAELRYRLLLTRWRLKAQNRTLYRTALAIFQHYDPLLIALYDPGEYEPEVDTILVRARTVITPEDLLCVIREEFNWWFGGAAASTPTYDRGYDRIASHLWIACRRHDWCVTLAEPT